MTKRKSTFATIRDVARRAGVSVATVSRYINQNTPVSPQTASRLEAAIADLHYVPLATARSLATHKTHTIGLLLTDIHSDFFAPLLHGIEDVTSENGFDLLISSTRRPEHRKGLRTPIGPHNTDGMLIFADSLDIQGLARLHLGKFPITLIHRSPPESLDIPCVTVENKAASRKIVEHLITVHGRRRILFLRGPQEQEDSHWRESGYRQALATCGIEIDPSLLARGDFERNVARASIQRLIASGVEFDAVFAGDDEAAVGVLAALHEAGIRVPEQVGVAGFDDQRMAPYLIPSLTTVRAPTEEVGREAARQLIRLIRGLPADPLILLPTEIIIRNSCGCGGA